MSGVTKAETPDWPAQKMAFIPRGRLHVFAGSLEDKDPGMGRGGLRGGMEGVRWGGGEVLVVHRYKRCTRPSTRNARYFGVYVCQVCNYALYVSYKYRRQVYVCVFFLCVCVCVVEKFMLCFSVNS